MLVAKACAESSLVERWPRSDVGRDDVEPTGLDRLTWGCRCEPVLDRSCPASVRFAEQFRTGRGLRVTGEQSRNVRRE